MKNKTEHKQTAEFIWKVCDLLRGNYKRNEYRKVVLPLVVLTRFDVILQDTKDTVLKKYESLKGKPENVIKTTLSQITNCEFYNVSKLDMKKLLNDPNQIAINLNAYISGFSSEVREKIALRRIVISSFSSRSVIYCRYCCTAFVIQRYIMFKVLIFYIFAKNVSKALPLAAHT